jgi:hypothetical protein
MPDGSRCDYLAFVCGNLAFMHGGYCFTAMRRELARGRKGPEDAAKRKHSMSTIRTKDGTEIYNQ